MQLRGMQMQYIRGAGMCTYERTGAVIHLIGLLDIEFTEPRPLPHRVNSFLERYDGRSSIDRKGLYVEE